MIPRDPKCVFVAADAGQASVVADWLEHQGVPARVMDTMTLGGLEGLTAWTGVSSRGVEVWVTHEVDADVARKLLAEHEGLQSSRGSQKASRGPVSALCEECGGASEFPGDRRGTVQNCPHCGRYMDVPDQDDLDQDAPEDTSDQQPASSGIDSTISEAVPRAYPRLRRLQKPILWFVLSCILLLLLAHFLAGIVSWLGGHPTSPAP